MGDIVLSQVAKDLIINIINIIVLFLIVRGLVYNPVKKFLSERTKRIEALNADAQKALNQANEAVSKRDQTIAQGNAEAERIIREAEEKARENIASITENARKSADDMIEKAQKEMQNEHDRMIESAKDEIAKLSVEISGHILKREISQEDNRRIVDDFFSAQYKSDNSGEIK